MIFQSMFLFFLRAGVAFRQVIFGLKWMIFWLFTEKWGFKAWKTKTK
jgi:hypothetical protein